MAMNPRLLRPTPSGFDPRKIADLRLWFDAADSSTILPLDGSSNVEQWRDKSGFNRHLGQTTSANRPDYASTLNGRPVVSFSGSPETMVTTATLSLAQPTTVFCVARVTSAALTSNIFFDGPSARTSLYRPVGSWGMFAGTVLTGATPDNNWHVFAATFNSTSSALRVDAAQVLSGNAGAGSATLTTFQVGAFSATQYLIGSIGEIILYGGALPSATASLVERYLAAKWGITLYSPPAYADADVNAYITAVEIADGGVALEPGVRNAINDFITGCKADGIWSAIKASCILAGARTLAGALTPLVGSAPTNNGPFVSGDYNRKTGLVGNASSKYLDTNRNNNADGQDSNHQALWLTSAMSISQACIGAGGASGGSTQISTLSGAVFVYRSRNQTGVNGGSSTGVTGFLGMSRAASAGYDSRDSGTTTARTQASQAAYSGNVFVFARESAGSAGLHTGARIAFYSVGEALNLSQLDARVSTLITAIGAAI